MRLEPNINDYISQIRFRARRREASFRRSVDALYSEAGVSGASGALVRNIAEALSVQFDQAISELLDYLDKSASRTHLDSAELYQVTAQELINAAASFKGIVNLDRLLKFMKSERARVLMAEEFEALDQLLTLRLREYQVGLRDGMIVPPPAPVEAQIPAANRYVTISDNEKGAVGADLIELDRAVAGDNEVAEEDRLIARSEIAAFEATITQPRVSSELVDRFVNRVLSWIAATFSGAAVKVVVCKIIEALMKVML